MIFENRQAIDGFTAKHMTEKERAAYRVQREHANPLQANGRRRVEVDWPFAMGLPFGPTQVVFSATLEDLKCIAGALQKSADEGDVTAKRLIEALGWEIDLSDDALERAPITSDVARDEWDAKARARAAEHIAKYPPVVD